MCKFIELPWGYGRRLLFSLVSRTDLPSPRHFKTATTSTSSSIRNQIKRWSSSNRAVCYLCHMWSSFVAFWLEASLGESQPRDAFSFTGYSFRRYDLEQTVKYNYQMCLLYGHEKFTSRKDMLRAGWWVIK